MTGCSMPSSRPVPAQPPELTTDQPWSLSSDHMPRWVANRWTTVRGCSDEQHLDGSGYRHIHYRLARRGTSRRANLPYPWGVFSFPDTTPPGRIAWRQGVPVRTRQAVTDVMGPFLTETAFLGRRHYP